MDLSAAYCRVKVFKRETKEFLDNYKAYHSKTQLHGLLDNMLSIINYSSLGDYYAAIYLLREFNWYLSELILTYLFFDNDMYDIVNIMHKATCKSLESQFKYEYFNNNNNSMIIYECNNKYEQERILPKVIYLDKIN